MDLFSQIEREFENLYIENLECKLVLQRLRLCVHILMWLVEGSLLSALLQGNRRTPNSSALNLEHSFYFSP